MPSTGWSVMTGAPLSSAANSAPALIGVHRSELQDEHLRPLVQVAGSALPVAPLHAAERQRRPDGEVESMDDLGEPADRIQRSGPGPSACPCPQLLDVSHGGE